MEKKIKTKDKSFHFCPVCKHKNIFPQRTSLGVGWMGCKHLKAIEQNGTITERIWVYEINEIKGGGSE